MKKHRASKRYASALFELSKEENCVDQVSKDLTFIQELFNNNNELVQIFENPNVNKMDKKQILLKLFPEKIHPIVEKLAQLILDKNREMLLPEIIEWYLQMEDEYKNIQRAELITAFPLKKDQIEKLAQSFGKKIKKKIVFEETINKTILGGFIIKMADKVVDASITNSLNNIKRKLITAE